MITPQCSYVLVDELPAEKRHSSLPGQHVVQLMPVADQVMPEHVSIEISMDMSMRVSERTSKDSPALFSRRQPAPSASMANLPLPSAFRYSRSDEEEEEGGDTDASTPAKLRQCLLHEPPANWPVDFEGLRAWGVGVALLDWLELVAQPELGVDEGTLVSAFLSWVAGSQGPDKPSWWQSLAQKLGTKAPQPAPISNELDLFFDAQLARLEADQWPAAVTQLTLVVD